MLIRVDQKQAGPHALGILVPPGAKTLVILRPRALAWDLLPARWDGDAGQAPQFCLFSRDEAAGAARRLLHALEAAIQQRLNLVQTVGDLAGERFQIWLRTDEWIWIACRRTLGQAYQPMIVATQAEATREAEALAEAVWPALETRREYYVNTQHFS